MLGDAMTTDTAATIKLTKTMLDKSIIDANKSVQLMLDRDFDMPFDCEFYTTSFLNEDGKIVRNKFIITGTYPDGNEANITFYRTGTRGDKRISIQHIKKYAGAGDIVTLTADETDGDATRISIEVNPATEELSQ